MKTEIFDIGTILEASRRLGYTFSIDPRRVNVVGIRSSSDASNKFDDFVGVLLNDRGGFWNLRLFRGTTDPGLYYLANPMNVSGTAIVVPGQYRNSHKIGKHQGKYSALVQAAPLRVWRDANRDEKYDHASEQDAENAGINIHRASEDHDSTVVDKWSAGCQVIANPFDFELFMAYCTESAEIYGNAFAYTLFEESQLQND